MPQEIDGEGSETLPLCRNREAPLVTDFMCREGMAKPDDQPESSPQPEVACHRLYRLI